MEEQTQTTQTTTATTAPDASATATVNHTGAAQTTTATTEQAQTAAPEGKLDAGFLLDIHEPEKPALGEDGKPLLAGKYENSEKGVADLEKSYAEAQKLISKLTAVPDKYEVEPVFKDTGLAWKDAKQQAEVTDAFKNLRLSNEQVQGVLKLYGQNLSEVMAQYGPPLNPQVEREALRRNWGDQTDSRIKAVTDFAKTLPREVLQVPLGRSAAGLELLYSMLQQKTSPTVVKDTGAKPTDIRSMKRELVDMFKKPNVNADPAAQARIRVLSDTISQMEQSALT